MKYGKSTKLEILNNFFQDWLEKIRIMKECNWITIKDLRLATC